MSNTMRSLVSAVAAPVLVIGHRCADSNRQSDSGSSEPTLEHKLALVAHYPRERNHKDLRIG
jgi:hypothetical protein